MSKVNAGLIREVLVHPALVVDSATHRQMLLVAAAYVSVASGRAPQIALFRCPLAANQCLNNNSLIKAHIPFVGDDYSFLVIARRISHGQPCVAG